jgi:hypothetical protein
MRYRGDVRGPSVEGDGESAHSEWGGAPRTDSGESQFRLVSSFFFLFLRPQAHVCCVVGWVWQLCTRWIQVGAFYPFSRDHSTIDAPPHELYKSPAVAAVSRTVRQGGHSLPSASQNRRHRYHHRHHHGHRQQPAVAHAKHTNELGDVIGLTRGCMVPCLRSQVLTMRYRLLPYLYTGLYEAHSSGAMLAKPLFAAFPQDHNTHDIDDQ